MKISREWLQTYFEKSLPKAGEIADALTFHSFEIESVDNDVLDVKVTPNRGHDCLSYRGIAKEVSAILDLPLKDSLGLRGLRLNLNPKTDAVHVSIEDPALCRRYIAGYIKGVRVGPSPKWLVDRLAAMGQHSINNVVDATNYVMFNTGQPLHAFDASKLYKGPSSIIKDRPLYSIEVRGAREGEKIVALDEKEYILKDSMLVIADGNSDEVIGIAGVKGGIPAGISEATKHIIIESANFNGVSVRKTAQALKLRTDASQRFEQEISPELAGYGMRAAAELIQQLACPEQSRRAGEGLIGFTDEYPKPQKKQTVSVSLEKINKVLGTNLSDADVKNTFSRLAFNYNDLRNRYEVEVSFERLDLNPPAGGEEDLIEEIGRIVGYDKVPSVELPAFYKQAEINQNFAASERVRKDLTDLGYSEVFTSVFADKGEVAVANKIDSVKPYLRSTLTNGLNDARKKNVQNKDLLGLEEVKLFEIGTVWKGGKEEIMAGIVSEKEAAKEDPLSMYVKETSQYERLPISQTERYQSFSRYPSITRDIALWVYPEQGRGVPSASEVLDVIKNHAGNLLVKSWKFDEFKKPARPDDAGRSGGGDKISYAFRLVFQSYDRTLFDGDANERMESIYAGVMEEGWEVR